jgi:septum formation protein
MVNIVLASASPRRRQLLAAAGLAVDVRPTDIDETPAIDELPDALVRRLARQKAEALGVVDGIVVAADTTVALGSQILNKPVDDDDARRMLRALSGRAHSVFTGWCARHPLGGQSRSGVVETTVVFRSLTDVDIDAYLATGEHRDKAGAYGIQGAAAALVATVQGSLTNVIGLPVDEVVTAIRELQESL